MKVGTSITVGIAAHKPYPIPADSCYLPIHVGRALNQEMAPQFDSRYIGDNTGDNISSFNPTYCELTALYWLWRNCDSDYKGLVHYRRHLRSLRKKKGKRVALDKVVTGDELIYYLSTVDAVLPCKTKYYIETMQSHWNHTQPSEQLDSAEKVLSQLYPDYMNEFRTMLSRRSAHMYNMMVMRANAFDSYCAWLFPLLDSLVKELNPAIYEPFQARYPGRISELLLDVWIQHNRVTYKELPMVSPEPVNWISKGKGFLAAKYLGKKYEKSF